jgi:hypothetical protein
VVADLTIFHFVGGLIFIAGAVIVAKLLLWKIIIREVY